MPYKERLYYNHYFCKLTINNPVKYDIIQRDDCFGTQYK